MSETATVTVVVPTRDCERTLAQCLESVRAQSYTHLRLVVVDNFSADATPEIAKAHADRVVIAGPERSAQRNLGWHLAPDSEYIAFIDADMVLDPDVISEAVAVLEFDDGVGGVVIPERTIGVGFFASCRALEKQLYVDDERVEALRVTRRGLLEAQGGYNERLTAFEDWDLHDRIVAAGYRVGRTQAGIRHDEGRVRLSTAFAKKRYYGGWLRTARLTGALTRPLARRVFVRRPGLLVRAPHKTAGLIVLKAVECAGMLLGAALNPTPARGGPRR